MAPYIAVARLPILSCAAILCGVALQGCSITVPRHSVGIWETKPNYLTEYQYVIPGAAKTSMLNSCNDPAIAGTSLPCNGHGRCRAWNDLQTNIDGWAKRLSFCECDRDYADPECRTYRKSQVTTFVLAMFLGMFGAEQFYTGFPRYGILKLLVVGVIGIWCAWRISRSDKARVFHTKAFFVGLATFVYLFEIVRTGSTTVLTAHNFRVADDFSHFNFVLSTVAFMLFIGFFIAIWSIHDLRKRKAHELLLLRLDAQEAKDEELHHHHDCVHRLSQAPMPMIADASPYTGYGSTLSMPPAGPPVRMHSQLIPQQTIPQGGAHIPMTILSPMPSATLPPTMLPSVTLPASMPSYSMLATPSNLTIR